MTEARLESLASSVDAYIIMESNFTTYGSPKALEMLDKMREGWLQDHQHKMAYVFLSYFTEKGKTNGWFADSFLRLYLGKEGMKLIAGRGMMMSFFCWTLMNFPTKKLSYFLRYLMVGQSLFSLDGDGLYLAFTGSRPKILVCSIFLSLVLC